jgi:hypothetical protein
LRKPFQLALGGNFDLARFDATRGASRWGLKPRQGGAVKLCRAAALAAAAELFACWFVHLRSSLQFDSVASGRYEQP